MGGASAPFCRIQASSSAPVSPAQPLRHRRRRHASSPPSPPPLPCIYLLARPASANPVVSHPKHNRARFYHRYDRPLLVAQPNPTFTGCRPHLSVHHLQLGPSTSHLPGTAYPNILCCSPTQLQPSSATSHFSSTRPQPVSWTTPLDTGGCILRLAPPRRHDAQETNHDLY
eukprot:CAMPEP_0172573646 /NCGR_PEP_ID=MMETSP1067-20121228/136296_1 /TAXON_ID=265564 ORGANISM="Thalassiosira punctigera, Strain Tpunct2005C2" /NCGR_SAMPLE_ID=MMETSP1067 /ASSEMBLY_ACC=CAM_ASM_000444 /LENGTH=170 /DNA_ID=CAMNT_0013366253 /DNA_START=110 /DNA_END=622 /DNA_ORIENTATION=+